MAKQAMKGQIGIAPSDTIFSWIIVEISSRLP
jgi:hypothetical protein